MKKKWQRFEEEVKKKGRRSEEEVKKKWRRSEEEVENKKFKVLNDFKQAKLAQSLSELGTAQSFY